MNKNLENLKKVLVIDDEELIRELMGEVIKMLGHEPILCGSPTQAIKLFSEYHRHISLVFMDMMMPEINGQELFQEFVKIDESKKVIILSGYVSGCETNKLLDDGVTAFIQKPISVKKISEIIKQYID